MDSAQQRQDSNHDDVGKMMLGLHHLVPAILLPTGFFPPEQVVFETQHSNSTGLPVPNPTHSFWIDSPHANPLAKEGSSGPLTKDADVCIIGAGITGVSSAYHLAQKLGTGKTVVILEARDFCEVSQNITVEILG
jgi:hypothetical protein